MGVKAGLIINPDAGKDIRRLLSSASYLSNFTKIELGRRVVRGLDAGGVDEVLVMHDNSGLGEDVVITMSKRVSAKLTLVETKGTGTVLDTMMAAKKMKESNARAIVAVGGDGTLRAVFKSCGTDIPIVCVAAGTNNVTGAYYDATLAGYAAGLVASGRVLNNCLIRAKSLEVLLNGEPADVAVIDVAILKTPYVGARAIVDIDCLAYAVFSKGEPTDIGLASILGFLRPTPFESDVGYLVEFGEGGLKVRSVVMPGELRDVSVKSLRPIRIGEVVEILRGRYTVALDGEREIEVTKDDSVGVRLSRSGPSLINVYKTLRNVSAGGIPWS